MRGLILSCSQSARTAFAQQILPWLEGQLAYDATLAGSDGLIVTGSQISTTNGGYDWDFYDGAKTGGTVEKVRPNCTRGSAAALKSSGN